MIELCTGSLGWSATINPWHGLKSDNVLDDDHQDPKSLHVRKRKETIACFREHVHDSSRSRKSRVMAKKIGATRWTNDPYVSGYGELEQQTWLDSVCLSGEGGNIAIHKYVALMGLMGHICCHWSLGEKAALTVGAGNKPVPRRRHKRVAHLFFCHSPRIGSLSQMPVLPTGQS
jgi:hypothetical protein